MNISLSNVFGNGYTSMNIEGRIGNQYTTNNIYFRYACLAYYIITGDEFYYYYETNSLGEYYRQIKTHITKLRKSKIDEFTIRKAVKASWGITWSKEEIEQNEMERREWEKWVAYRKSL